MNPIQGECNAKVSYAVFTPWALPIWGSTANKPLLVQAKPNPAQAIDWFDVKTYHQFPTHDDILVLQRLVNAIRELAAVGVEPLTAERTKLLLASLYGYSGGRLYKFGLNETEIGILRAIYGITPFDMFDLSLVQNWRIQIAVYANLDLLLPLCRNVATSKSSIIAAKLKERRAYELAAQELDQRVRNGVLEGVRVALEVEKGIARVELAVALDAERARSEAYLKTAMEAEKTLRAAERARADAAEAKLAVLRELAAAVISAQSSAQSSAHELAETN